MKRQCIRPITLPYLWSCVAMLCAVLVGAFVAEAAPARQVVRRHLPAGALSAKPVAHMAPNARLTLAIGLPLRNQAELQALLQQLYDPSSTHYHHYLTPEEFTARFGPSEEDYRAVKAFAAANGLD